MPNFFILVGFFFIFVFILIKIRIGYLYSNNIAMKYLHGKIISDSFQSFDRQQYTFQRNRYYFEAALLPKLSALLHHDVLFTS